MRLFAGIILDGKRIEGIIGYFNLPCIIKLTFLA